MRAPLVPVALAVLLVSCLGERPLGLGMGGTGGDGAISGVGGGNGGGSGSGGGGGTSNLGGGGTSGTNGGAVAGVATQLGFAQLVPTRYTSKPFEPIVVQIQDGNGTLVSTAEGTVTLALGSNPGGANLIGYLTATARNGVAVFDTVGLDQVAAGYTLTASAEGLASATSPAFNVVRLPFERVTTGLYGGRLTHVASTQVIPSGATAPTLYAAGPGGVFRSSNNGGSWVASNFGNPPTVGLVVVDPVNPARVYTTPSFGSISYQGAGLHITRSDDGGNAWRPLEGLAAVAPGASRVGALVIDPVNPSILYAGNSAGIFRSRDAGASWVKTSFAYAADYALTIDPLAPATLYAVGYQPDPYVPQGLFKTIDSGDNWAPVNNPSLPPGIVTDTPQALVATPNGVFINDYRSLDGGNSWVAGNGMLSLARAFAYSPSNVMRLYATEGAFVRVSNDGGLSFGPALSPGRPIDGLAVDPGNADRVYAATDSGIFVSTNAGATWSSTSQGIATQLLYAVAVDPGNTNNVFVGALGGVYVTNDAGVTWQFTELDVGFDEVTAITVDPDSPSTVYACTQGGIIQRSDNSGMTWNPPTDTGGGPFCYDIAVSGSSVWVATIGGIRRSINGGVTWEPNSNLDLLTYSVAVARGGLTLYASSEEGTHRSITSGTSWTPMTSDYATAFAVDPNTPTNVYMGIGCDVDLYPDSAGGIRRSINSGAEWGPVVGTACIAELLALAEGRVLALGNTPEGLPYFAVSSDRGVTWQEGGLGIEGQVTGLTASADGQTVYVSTTVGLFKASAGGL